MLEVVCDGCGAAYKAPENFAGRKMTCKACSGAMLVVDKGVSKEKKIAKKNPIFKKGGIKKQKDPMSVKSRLLVRTGGKKTLSTQEDSGQKKESGGTHPQRLCLIILAGIGALGPFLPWLTMSYGMMGESGSGIGRGLGAAWVILILFGIAIWACLLGDKTKPVLEVPRGVAVLSGLVSATIAIEKLITFHSWVDCIRPIQSTGSAYSSLIYLSFSATQWVIQCATLIFISTVVTQEHYQSIFTERLFLKGVKNSSHCAINLLHHGGIDLSVRVFKKLIFLYEI